MLEKIGSKSGMQPASTFIIIIPMIFESLGVQRSIFSTNLELAAFVSQPIHYLPMILSLKPENTGWYFTSQKSQIQNSHFSQYQILAIYVQKVQLDS